MTKGPRHGLDILRNFIRGPNNIAPSMRYLDPKVCSRMGQHLQRQSRRLLFHIPLWSRKLFLTDIPTSGDWLPTVLGVFEGSLSDSRRVQGLLGYRACFVRGVDRYSMKVLDLGPYAFATPETAADNQARGKKRHEEFESKVQCFFGNEFSAQRAQYGLIKEYTLNDILDPYVISAILLA